MKRPSFSTQLMISWGLVAAICAMLAAVIAFIASSVGSEQVAGAKERAAAACEAVASRYGLSDASSRATSNRDLMRAVLDVVLLRFDGVEGGFWTNAPPPAGSTQDSPARSGFLAYAFPTYQGSGVKRDIPEAETPLILRTLQAAAAQHASAQSVIESGQDAVVAAACPVRGEGMLLAWMLTRARPPLGPHGEALSASLAIVLAVILVIAVVLALALRRWKRNLVELEGALSPGSEPPGTTRFEPLGEPDLDKIVAALNRYVERTAALQQQAADLAKRLAEAERFGVLGRLAAEIAHEIRNPAGAMRLKAENALAADSARQRDALRVIIEQIGRIETQLASLLALTQPIVVRPVGVDVARWLEGIVEAYRERAEKRRVTLALELRIDADASADAASPVLRLDPEQLRRALDNLLINALRHVGEDGTVIVSARRVSRGGESLLAIEVADDGPGVPPDQRARIFEPFVTGRPDGTGLGLAVVREVASAHGGLVRLDDAEAGARFIMEIPWQPSS
jgi:signal transduction histidine kinase